jgi:polygalacturonase
MRNAPLLAVLLAQVLSQAAELHANDYGAKGDGTTLNTAAIQKALDRASATGDTVVLSPGIYLTGALFLRSGTHLHLDAGVELRAIQEQSAYPLMPTRVAGVEMIWPAALINIYEQSNVKITGQGVIDGDGKFWWDKYWRLRQEYEGKGLRWAADYDSQRVRLLQIFKSDHVEIQGLNLRRSGFWTVHICYSKNVTVDGITIRNNIGGRGPSTDGIGVDSSSDVLIQNADIENNDDAIVMKAGRDSDGLRVNRPTENVVVHDITVRDGAAGITFGSETSGSIRHVEAYRIHVLAPTPIGILFKSASTRGGTLEDINIHDIDMQGGRTAFSVTFNWNPSYSYAKIPQDMTGPDYWQVLAAEVPRDKGIPHLRNVRISNFKATGVQEAFSVASYPDSLLQNVTFQNLEIQAQRAGQIANAENWKFENTHIQTSDGSQVATKDSRGITGLPSK